MSATVRMTKQGVRDLDFGVKRKAAPEADPDSKKADQNVDAIDAATDVNGSIPLDEPPEAGRVVIP